MEDGKKFKLMVWFNFVYVIVFSAISFFERNIEFIYYSAIMFLLISLILYYHRRVHFPISSMIGLTIVGLIHSLGGNIWINGSRLYDVWIIQDLFKYDNLVHFASSFVLMFILYSLLYPLLDKHKKPSKLILLAILILITTGVGAFWEVLELFAVIFFGAANAVGDYMNNALDLLFNLIGSVIASFFVMRHHVEHIKTTRR